MNLLPHTFRRRGLADLRWCRLLSLIIVAAVSLCAYAENRITIRNFTHDENEGTALTLVPGGVKDNNRQKCALIIVHNVETGGFTFNTGGWNKAENRSIDGKPVVNLWVSPGTKWVEVGNSDPAIEPSARYQFGRTVESEKTYHLWLGEIVRTSLSARQFVTVRVDAPEATLFVDENHDGRFLAWPLRNGRASKSLPLGTYDYKLTAPDYYDEYGRITVDDPNNAVNVELKLRPNFGHLTIPGSDNLHGAQIIIDGVEVGMSSLNEYKLGSGTHSLQVQKPKYKVYVSDITIEDNKTLTQNIVLEPNFSSVTIESADPQAEIWLLENGDETKMATGKWLADIEPGNYVVETRRAGCKSAMKQITVAPSNGEQLFTLPAPEPTYGSIEIISDPDGAGIYLDGTAMGATPKVLNNVLATTHNLRLTYPAYNDYNTTIDVKQGRISDINAVMTKYVKQETVADNTVRTVSKTRLLKKKQFYAEVGVMGGYMPDPLAALVSVGFDCKWFNVQLGFDYVPELREGDMWRDYYASGPEFSLRLGYNFNCSRRFRITPQIGVYYSLVYYEADIAPFVAARCYFAIKRWFGISLTPEFRYHTNANDFDEYNPSHYYGEHYADFGVSLNVAAVFTF